MHALLGSPCSSSEVVFHLFAVSCLGGQCSFKSVPGEVKTDHIRDGKELCEATFV